MKQPRPAPCPGPHTPCPEEYLAWHDWAEQKAKTHVQRKCPECGLWAIWEPKEQQCASR